MKHRRGIFIVLEGVDGSGTTTQSERIALALRERGRPTLVTREPSEGPIGVMIRQALTHRLVFPQGEGSLSAQTLALLFAADRADHLASSVLPALREGFVIISDRYLLSSLVYQGPDTSMGWVETINSFARKPDLTLFLDVGTQTASKRRASRGGRAELFEVEKIQRRLRRRYHLAVSRRLKSEAIVVLDGEAPPEMVTTAALSALEPLL